MPTNCKCPVLQGVTCLALSDIAVAEAAVQGVPLNDFEEDELQVVDFSCLLVTSLYVISYAQILCICRQLAYETRFPSRLSIASVLLSLPALWLAYSIQKGQISEASSNHAG